MPAEDDEPIPEVVEHPIGPELDLHTFRPNEIGNLLPEYFAECRRRGVLRVRIIHGNKGRVEGSADEPAMVLDGSGYQATLRTLPTFGCSLHEAPVVA